MYMYIYTLMYSKNLVGIIILYKLNSWFFFSCKQCIKMKNVLNDKKASITYIIIFLIRYIDLI